MSKLIIFSAPSGSGKSTLIDYLLGCDLGLEFSISATSRLPRGNEQNGVEYHFLSQSEFEEKIANDEFVEYEEVYKGTYYGTLISEIERISKKGNIVIFDVDVVGGVNLKEKFADQALSIFIAPPSIDELRSRLESRKTDSQEMIERRLAKAEFELGFKDKFDKVVVNDDLEIAKKEAEEIIRGFVSPPPPKGGVESNGRSTC